jgi:hypothetical protein
MDSEHKNTRIPQHTHKAFVVYNGEDVIDWLPYQNMLPIWAHPNLEYGLLPWWRHETHHVQRGNEWEILDQCLRPSSQEIPNYFNLKRKQKNQ